MTVTSIRDLRREELPELLALYAHLHRSDEPLPAPAVVDRVWQELISHQGYRYIGLFQDGTLISSCTITLIPNLTRGCRPYGVIENVVTLATHRNRGHGKAVLAHALSQAWAGGCYKVMLMTGRKDAATFAFYQAAGFDADEKQAFIAKPPA